MVRNFHRDKGTPMFCAKLDIRKAYDSIPWDAVLIGRGEASGLEQFRQSFLHLLFLA